MFELNRLYNMDCMEAMREIPDKYFELAICDPPYGGKDAIGLKDNSGIKKQAAKRTQYKVFENIAPTQEYFDELKRISKNQIIFGVNFYKAEGLDGGRLVWDKHGTAFGRAEIAYLSMTKSVEIYEYTWNGMIQQDMKNKEFRIHPTQKPVALYEWIISKYAKDNDKIIDTHAGSGSCLIAAHKTRHDFLGFEIDADYFQKAQERIKTEQAQMNIFDFIGGGGMRGGGRNETFIHMFTVSGDGCGDVAA